MSVTKLVYSQFQRPTGPLGTVVDLGAGLKEVGRVVRSGGRIVVAVQPIRRGATEDDSARWVEKFSAAADTAEAMVLEIARGATSPSTVARVLKKS